MQCRVAVGNIIFCAHERIQSKAARRRFNATLLPSECLDCRARVNDLVLPRVLRDPGTSAWNQWLRTAPANRRRRATWTLRRDLAPHTTSAPPHRHQFALLFGTASGALINQDVCRRRAPNYASIHARK